MTSRGRAIARRSYGRSRPAGRPAGPWALCYDRRGVVMLDVTTPEASLGESGIDFALSEEQRAGREIDPIVDEIDEAQKFPHEVMRKAGELGFLGVIFPEELGGAGLGYVEYVLVITELSAVDPSVGISVAAHNSLCSNHIYKFGNDEQRRRWLQPLASGEKIGAWSLTEPNAGSDAGGTRTRAEKVDGGWVLNGAKTFTTHGSVGDVCVVFAVTESEARKGHNLSTFVVEKGTPGFRSGKKENKLGIRASDTAEVVMEDCFLPDDALLGERGEGFQQAMVVLDGGRISIAALGLGTRSEEHTSELQSQSNLVCRLLLEKKNIHLWLPDRHRLRTKHPVAGDILPSAIMSRHRRLVAARVSLAVHPAHLRLVAWLAARERS